MPNPNFKGPPLGNKNGEKKNRVVTDTLRRVAAQNPEKLRSACEALLDKAASGDVAAYKEIRDTLDGKPAQSIDLGITDGSTAGHLEDSQLLGIIAKDSSSGTTVKKARKDKSTLVH